MTDQVTLTLDRATVVAAIGALQDVRNETRKRIRTTSDPELRGLLQQKLARVEAQTNQLAQAYGATLEI